MLLGQVSVPHPRSAASFSSFTRSRLDPSQAAKPLPAIEHGTQASGLRAPKQPPPASRDPIMALFSTSSILGGGLLRAAACSAVQLLPKATALAARPWAAAGPSGPFSRGYVQPAPDLEPETDRGERAHAGAVPDALLRAAPRRRADPAAAIPEVFGQVRGPCEHAPSAAARSAACLRSRAHRFRPHRRAVRACVEIFKASPMRACARGL